MAHTALRIVSRPGGETSSLTIVRRPGDEDVQPLTITSRPEPETSPQTLGEELKSFGTGLAFPATEAAALSRSAATESRALLPLQIARGLGTAVLEGARALPDIARNLFAGGERRAETVRGFGRGLLESEVGGADRPIPERIGRGISSAALALSPFAPRVLRGLRQTRAARAAAPGIIQRSTPPAPVSRQLAVAPDEIVQQIERRAAAEAVTGRVSAQEAADRSLAAQRAVGQAPVTTPPPPGVSLVRGIRPVERNIDTAIREGLEEAARLEGPSRVSLPPERFGTRAGPVQPEVSFSARRRPTAPPGVTGVVPRGKPTPAARVAPIPSGALPGRAPRPVTAPGIPEGPIRRGMTATEPTSGTVVKVIDIRPNGQLLVSNVGEAVGTRTPSRLVPADSLINFTKPRRGQARAFEQTGTPIQTIQDVKRGLGSESGRVSPGVLATVAAGGVGGLTGAALGGEGNRVGGFLGGAAVGAGAVGGILRGVRAAGSLGSAALTARREAFLSGAAIPKNIGTALGAPVVAAAETGSLAPLRQLPRLTREIGRALARPRQIPGIPLEAGQRLVGPVSRRIGAIDAVAEQALRRGVPGITQAQIDRALVKTPLAQTIGRGDAFRMLTSPQGRFVFPFQRTPFDVAVGGATEAFEALGGPATRGALGTAGRRRAITAGVTAGGAATGEVLKDEGPKGFLLAALIASLVGRRAVPFSLGAAVTGGPNFLRGLSPTPEFALDPKQMIPTAPRDIAFVRLLEQLSTP